MRHGLFILLAVPMLAMAAQADTVERATLAVGESITVQLSDNGAIDILSRGTATADAQTLDSAKQTASGALNGAIGKNVAIVTSDKSVAVSPPQPDRLKISFLALPVANQRMLIIENGYPRALRYHAQIATGDKSAATDVCLVMPQRRGIEHWPYPIDRITLSDLHLQDWKPGDPIPCE